MDPLDRYDSLYRYYGEKYGVDWRLLKAQGIVESGLDPDAFNSQSGAAGLAQFIQKTWEEWKDGLPGFSSSPPPGHTLIWDPEDAIRAQAAYMAWLLENLKSVVEALAAYNWGIGRVLRARRRHRERWLERAPEETRLYVRRIQRIFRECLREDGTIRRSCLRRVYDEVQ